jgi:hypothetical protein
MRPPIDVPPQVRTDPDSEDIVRVWGMSDRSQIFSVRVSRWDDPAAWGLLLADLARHIAKSYAAEGSRTEDAALGRIIAGLRAELPMDVHRV